MMKLKKLLLIVVIFFNLMLMIASAKASLSFNNDNDDLNASHECTYSLYSKDKAQKHIIQDLLEYKKVLATGLATKKQKFGTTLYYLLDDETLPDYEGVSKHTKAIVIAFGGAGVDSASGRSYMVHAHTLRKYSVALVSFDYPFHGEGPRNDKYFMANEVLGLVTPILKHYKKLGLPIYLVGHSFGPALI